MNSIDDISFPKLGIYLSHIPDGIHVFGREIRFYAIIIAAAFIIAMFLATREAKKTRQNPDDYLDAFLVTIIPAIIGARLYYVVFNWSNYKSNPLSILYVWQGGLAIYGGVIVGIITLFVFSRIRRISFGLLLDTLVPGLVLGQGIGRWGNFFNREAFGGNCNSLFAMRIPADRIHVTYSSAVSVIEKGKLSYVQVQPTFLYESMLCLVIFLLLLLLRRKKKADGEVFLLYAFLYGIGRFIIESMRTDQLILCKIGEIAIPVSQVVAILFIIVSVVFFIIGRYRVERQRYISDDSTNTDVDE